ncbi:nitric oxide reductase transcriptional regulator NorR [Pseudoalteromonas denitrificans]|uniref:Anaerobic nitric oxide reductase transcription regulator n=1 Tax=Pseudoalteromonas denitrificans DSM 6059 TaxID=1123010 RepID=A0A1I1RLR9_9GAMM|nr:nitric oxide reductase transcriptional regulator NorR [Pseudoalteromonas denitrificans]SFD33238.1 anaerobic nitric oxide reductase transcription regulator [Pseudoalteromonas denitrificans DSM 6059]
MNEITSSALIELALDLAKSLTSEHRFDRLLDTVRKTIQCDAVALLSYHQDVLKPLALQGLSRDTLGRRFIINEHPRFEQLCLSTIPIRFAADSPLPDPYDGLLIDKEGDLPVHSCMGLPLYFDNKLLGLLTIDSLTPHLFENIPNRTLEMISAIAAATLNTALMIDQLESQAIHSQKVVAELTEEALMRDGGELIGQSNIMQKLKQELDIVAASDFNILIYGETGVGKELVARTLHQKSLRSNGPLVYVNCAALPENLIESELFGHVKGAFTGAEQNRAGKFAIANNGTLFLDEIGELPLAAQSKILRAIQNNEIQPVGQDNVEEVNVRIFAATNRNLQEEVDGNRFRADLYHRLSVYPVRVPALNERYGDVQLLAGYFVGKVGRKLGLNQLKIDSGAVSYLNEYNWPGNVRELEHVISRAALKARARQKNKAIISIEKEDCGSLITTQLQDKLVSPHETQVIQNKIQVNLREATDDFQRALIKNALSEENGNWAATARRLQTDRANLNRVAKRLNIKVIKSVI